MEMKDFLKRFVVVGELIEFDMDEICFYSESEDVLRRVVERAFRLGVAEGLSSAEHAVARALKVDVDDMEDSNNPALHAVMRLSEQCRHAAHGQMNPGRFVSRPDGKRYGAG
jgi:hypothetical protein